MKSTISSETKSVSGVINEIRSNTVKLKGTLISNLSLNIKNSATNNYYRSDKLISRLLDVLSMRIAIENINIKSNEDLKEIITSNLTLVDLKHIQIHGINKFVDDIIEILKKSEEDQMELTNTQNEETSRKINVDKIYRPNMTEENFRARRTIEIVLEKPKGISKGRLKFGQDFPKQEEHVFYKDAEESKNFNHLGVYQFKKKIIDELCTSIK